jgi:hypothetical protein
VLAAISCAAICRAWKQHVAFLAQDLPALGIGIINPLGPVDDSGDLRDGESGACHGQDHPAVSKGLAVEHDRRLLPMLLFLLTALFGALSLALRFGLDLGGKIGWAFCHWVLHWYGDPEAAT